MQEYIEKEKEKYKKLGHAECPAFEHEKIYFNRHGLRHLMRKNGIPRPILEQRRKFKLMQYVPDALKKVTKIARGATSGDIHFWSLTQKGQELILIIIVRQIKNGPKHFYSVMGKRLPKSAKDP